MKNSIKRVILPAIALCTICALTGCEREALQDFWNQSETETGTYETEQPEPTTEQTTVVLQDFSTKEVDYYAYDTLNESQQKLYHEIEETLANSFEYTDISTLDTDELNFVFKCVMDDHPEYFYVDGYQFKKFTLDGNVTRIQFFGNYTMTKEEIEEYQKQIDHVVGEIFAALPDTSDQYVITKYLYEWVIQNTDYDLNADNNQNICSVFLTHMSVCQGYAKAFQYLMQKAGIETVLVTGMANQDGHAWNLTKVNGAYYYVDVTWGDASYIYADDSMIQSMQPINYDYLLVTTEEISRTHHIDETYQLPVADEDKDSYYVRENLLLDQYDESRIAEIFEKAYENNQDYVTLKFINDGVYDTAKQKLMDEQRIFQFISQNGNKISYTENRQQRTLSFWI